MILPRLKDPLYYEEEDNRMVILRLMFHKYNFQTAQVGINQIMIFLQIKRHILDTMYQL